LALLATTGPISVGCILAWLLDDELQILDIVVHPTHRRQGIGKALLKVLLTQAQERGCTLATLEVSEDNAAAVQLYQQLGFQQVHVRKSYYRNGSADEQMRVKLRHQLRLHSCTGSHRHITLSTFQ